MHLKVIFYLITLSVFYDAVSKWSAMKQVSEWGDGGRETWEVEILKVQKITWLENVESQCLHFTV